MGLSKKKIAGQALRIFHSGDYLFFYQVLTLNLGPLTLLQADIINKRCCGFKMRCGWDRLCDIKSLQGRKYPAGQENVNNQDFVLNSDSG